MATRGGFAGLTQEQVAHLLSLTTAQEKADYLNDLFDDRYWQDLDKAWYRIHRCLSNYPPEEEWLTEETTKRCGTYPLNIAICGGHNLNSDEDPGWILYLKDLRQLSDLIAALEPVTEDWLSERYWAMGNKQTYPEHGEEDRGYTWAYFDEGRDFLKRMLAEGRSVVFLADQ
jgi:hypothetical protein